MITISPIKTVSPITFGEGSVNNITPGVAILSLQNPNARVNFQKDFDLTQKSDAVQANPLTALGYKFVKTYNILFNHKRNNPTERPHLPYMA